MREITTERTILERVLEAIGRETGIAARVLRWQPEVKWHTRLQPDALVEFHALPQPEQYAVEVRNIGRYEMLTQIRGFWPRNAKPPLLIAAPYVSTQLAERCREMDLFFADTAGNVYLK